MSGSVLKRTFSKGVGRRIFGFFLLASIVPILITAALAYQEIGRSAQEKAAKELKHSAKAYGIDILTRLQLTAEKAREVRRRTVETLRS